MADQAQLPRPPWQAGSDRRPVSRRTLDREQILDAALVVLDAEGVDGVSMRRVAQELGTGPASLYAHVASKQELLNLLFDRVVGDVSVPRSPGTDWQDQLREFGRQVLGVCVAHRDIARVVIGNVPFGPNALRTSEALLTILLEAGLPAKIASWAIDSMSAYVITQAYEAAIRNAQMEAVGLDEEAFTEAWKTQAAAYFAALPRDRFPSLAGSAEDLVGGTGSERFEFGMDLIIRGLESHLPRRREGTRRPVGKPRVG